MYLQIGRDGEAYYIADPNRPVLEDFDKIFNDNDEKKLLELERLSRKMGPGGVLPQVRPHFFLGRLSFFFP